MRVEKVAFWLLLVGLFVAGYATRAEQEKRRNARAKAAADSVLADAQRHVAGLTRYNNGLADSLHRSDSAIARHRLAAQRSADRARTAESQAATIRSSRAGAPDSAAGAGDSVAYYRAQLAAADRETELLRVALDQRWEQLAAGDSIDRIQRRQIALLTAAKDSAVAQLTRVVPALEAARAAIAAGERRCRLAFGIPCPSRKAVAIGTAATVVVAIVVLHRPAQSRAAVVSLTRRGVLPLRRR